MAAGTRRAFLAGLRDGAPFVLVVGPFALLFGVLAAEAGWRAVETLGMSVAVIAGASQFAALQLMRENAPVVLVVLTALAVNLRMALYSASIAPHFGPAPFWQRALAAYVLTDQTYGTSINRFTLMPGMTTGEKLAYYAGTTTLICPLWFVLTVVGNVAGQAIPPEFALDFAAPITFIALFAPALRTLPHVAAALVSVLVSLALNWMPYNLWMLVAAGLAMATGAGVEVWLERRRAGPGA